MILSDCFSEGWLHQMENMVILVQLNVCDTVGEFVDCSKTCLWLNNLSLVLFAVRCLTFRAMATKTTKMGHVA